ncbi:hypothetical protein Glove_179g4 [Diversispora epigaea]|uniref:Mid2 domain-containing protein n=1 Tax=Diversispora epigaea TaxID=1348612 RepID=A0A397IN44_9GLOM|nr:hypothetical protein Glove_179g4 [Diversispora epigaea]
MVVSMEHSTQIIQQQHYYHYKRLLTTTITTTVFAISATKITNKAKKTSTTTTWSINFCRLCRMAAIILIPITLKKVLVLLISTTESQIATTTITNIITDTQLDIPSQTTTTGSNNCRSMCSVDASVDILFDGFAYTSIDPDPISTTITPSTLKKGPNIITSYKTTVFFRTITIYYPGYTTTYIITSGLSVSLKEYYVTPKTTVIIQKATAVILFVSTATPITVTATPNSESSKPFLIGLGTGIGVVVLICIAIFAIFVFCKRRNGILRINS